MTLFIIGCGGVQDQSTSSESERITAPKRVFAFTPPIIPATLTDDKARMEYFTTHYWDNFNFADSLLIHNDSIVGTAIAGYISLLEINTPTLVEQSIEKSLLHSINSNYDNFLHFSYKLEDYLDNPNSPMRNEELYIPVLQFIINSQLVESVDKLRPQSRLEMALKNRVGEVATNIEYTLNDGSRHNLHDIVAKYTILFFNSPDCSDCGRVKSYMMESEVITELQASGELQILAIYPESDLDIWRSVKYSPMMINSYDDGETITKNRLYDLRAIPTLYLLDKEKKVVLKDAFIDKIELFVENN